MSFLKLFAVKTRIVKVGDNLVDLIVESLKSQNLYLESNDVLAITSKIVSYSEGRIAQLGEVKPSDNARKLAVKYSLDPEFAELILRETDRIYGGVYKAVLTFKNDMMTPNAGIDSKNTSNDCAVLWPSNPEKSAKEIREGIKHKMGKTVAVMIVDSGLVPLRKGTNGLALAVAGFKPIRDSIGKKDLFGKKITITRQAVADDLASAAHLLMGEATERTPVVLIKDAPLDFDDEVHGAAEMIMPFDQCIFMSIIERQLLGGEKS
jgi:coenzyme F420-0:L-glutamate ligase/coenzyme F420-1:gamma-L-glutamate ligase